jgi:hypothetical protein
LLLEIRDEAAQRPGFGIELQSVTQALDSGGQHPGIERDSMQDDAGQAGLPRARATLDERDRAPAEAAPLA